MKKITCATVLFCVLLVRFQGITYSYAPSGHEEITKRVIDNNSQSLNAKLTGLGVEGGIDEFIDGKKIRKWLEEGSVKEDYTWDILVSHFYNPLTNEGIGKSAYERANDVWKRARESYYTGLTSTGSQREEALASSFEYLGRVMHLVQDMGVAAHTRNDLHIADSYEAYTKNKIGMFLNGEPVAFMMQGQPAGPYAPRYLWDTDSGSPSSGDSVGLAEYTNSNFFSDDTIDASAELPWPKIDNNTEIVVRPFEDRQRQYYLKNCCGETKGGQGYLLAAVDWLDYWRWKYPFFSALLPKVPILDSNVHKEYASLLIPRAVGYSAGVLDYFFRGKISGHDLVEVRNQYSKEIIGVQVTLRNDSAEALEGGRFVVVAKVNGDYFRVTQTADPAGESDQVLLRFMCPDGIGYCQIDNVEDIEYSLVYKGKLGLEDGAVVFGDSVTRRYDSVTFDSHSWILNATVGGNKYLSGPIWEDIPKAYDIIRVRFAQDNPHLVGVLVRTTGDKYQAHLYATHDNALVYAGMKAEVAYHEIVPNAIAVSYAPFHFSGGGASVDSVLTATPTGEGYILRQATDLYVSKAGNATIVGGYFSGASVNISLDYRYSNSLPDLTITSHAVDNHFTTTTAFSSYPSDTMTGTIDTQSTASFILSTGFFRNDALSPIQSGNTNINLPIRDTNFNATLMPCAYRCVAGYCGGYTGQWMSFKSYGGRDTYSFYSPFYSFNTDPETFEYVCETSVAPDGNVNYATNPTPSCPAQEKKLADIMPSVTYEALY